jgi:hypothetical protein
MEMENLGHSANATRVRRATTRTRRRLRAGAAGLVVALALSGTLHGVAPTALGAGPTAPSSPVHFLEPLAGASGDPAQFDGSLLADLVVSICRVEASGCTPLKTITSASSSAERLRIESGSTGSYYLANWDTSKVKLPPYSYRVSVSIEGLTLGSIDVTQGQYKSFGRTWPIKFRVDRDPAIHVRLLRAADKSASQIADFLRRQFGLGPDEVAALLAGDIDPFTDEEIHLAIRGVFQNAVIPPTTKVADAATQSALTTFDVGTGRMTFGTSTALLATLKTGDVLVGEPTAAAPFGYLRKVTSIVRPKKGAMSVETRQAYINEVVTKGTFDAAAQLRADDLDHVDTLPGVTVAETGSKQSARVAALGAFDIGDGYSFHETIDVTIDGSGQDGAVSGRGTIHIVGNLDFDAGYDVGFGVEDCLKVPFFVCVDRFEAHLKMDASSHIRVDGTFDGHMEKEYVLSTHYFKPIIFFIGPVPVVLVPIVKAIAGVNGDAHLEFSFEAQASTRLDFGAKWTDPAEGGDDWQDINDVQRPTGTGKGDLEADMELRAYAKGDAKLLFYGIAGPGLAGRFGVGAKAQYPHNPVWSVFAHGRGEINFAVDLGGVLKLSEHIEDLPEIDFEVAHADNEPPVCGTIMDPVQVPLDETVYLGPRIAPTYEGFFICTDPEGEKVTYSTPSTGGPVAAVTGRWDLPGTYPLEITATDESGKSRVFTLNVYVNNTPPILEMASASDGVPVSVQYFVTAAAWDIEDSSYLPCTSLAWTATGGTVTRAGDSRACSVFIVFDQVGSQTVKVVATDSLGKSSESEVTVNVTPAPANPAPVIDPLSFEVTAAIAPFNACAGDPQCDTRYNCISRTNCRVPYGAILYSGGVGEFRGPLTMTVSAADPNGDPLTTKWFCTAGANSYPVSNNGDGTFSCDPYTTSFAMPIAVWAEVSDGVTTVRSETRHFFMLDRAR